MIKKKQMVILKGSIYIRYLARKEKKNPLNGWKSNSSVGLMNTNAQQKMEKISKWWIYKKISPE